jgi:hypothetical protein
METEAKHDPRTVAELVKAFVALELEMTDTIPAECRRLHRQHRVCVELTARGAWTEAGPQIDAEIARFREMVRAGGSMQ